MTSFKQTNCEISVQPCRFDETLTSLYTPTHLLNPLLHLLASVLRSKSHFLQPQFVPKRFERQVIASVLCEVS